ncbi:MAG: NAD(P)-binding domain-containing protein, partial [Planctomycetota bacterium]|nr:NAD(P)-binding domain-containing protein [Planctomycetota bacterium]
MKHPIALIGAGPIGLEIAVNLKAAGVDYLHFEAAAPAQTIAQYPKSTQFFSSGKTLAICGLPFFEDEKPSKEQYVEYLRKVAQHFKLKLRSREKPSAIEPTEDGFILTSPMPPHSYKVSGIIFAIGNMHTPRRLGIPGEDGPRVHHRVDNPEQFAGQSVIVIGGRNSAVETALRCHRAGCKVSICYRGASFDNGSVKPWLLDELNQAIGNHKIDSYTRVVPTHMTPAGIYMKSQLTGLGKQL